MPSTSISPVDDGGAMFRQMLTQTDGSPPLKGGGLAGDFRTGCRQSTCVLVASSISMGWVELGGQGSSSFPSPRFGVEADFTWPLGSPM